MKSFKTDMAVEFAPHDGIIESDIKKSFISVDQKLSKKLSRPEGNYSTIESVLVANHDKAQYHRLIKQLADSLKAFAKKSKRVLVACLGNPDLTADALGERVFKKLIVNRHLLLGKNRYLCAVTPNVLGMTGIESFDIIKGVTERVKPDIVLAVDSLAASAPSRIAAAFQITDVGITPGSGVSNHRATLNRSSLGCEVLSIGVPLVVYVSTIVRELGHDFDNSNDLLVTPKDIDVLVEDCAFVIAEAINNVWGLA